MASFKYEDVSTPSALVTATVPAPRRKHGCKTFNMFTDCVTVGVEQNGPFATLEFAPRPAARAAVPSVSVTLRREDLRRVLAALDE